jgi:hypothetical protein
MTYIFTHVICNLDNYLYYHQHRERTECFTGVLRVSRSLRNQPREPKRGLCVHSLPMARENRPQGVPPHPVYAPCSHRFVPDRSNSYKSADGCREIRAFMRKMGCNHAEMASFVRGKMSHGLCFHIHPRMFLHF